MIEDVPSPIDLRSLADAQRWESNAMVRRPWRVDFFHSFVAAIASGPPRPRVLELGSGPGFLAAHLLRFSEVAEYVALDFSEAMHELAAMRLGTLNPGVTFLRRNFRDPDWVEGLGSFDWVVTLQAVHELRHKAHTPALAAQVLGVLKPGGGYLVADHYLGSDGMQDDQLYMTVEEQRAVLEAAGFEEVRCLLSRGGIVLHHGLRSNVPVVPAARSQIA